MSIDGGRHFLYNFPMAKRNPFPLVTLLAALLFSCRQGKPLLVPEISADLEEEVVWETSAGARPVALAALESSVILVLADGKVFNLGAGQDGMEKLFDLGFPVADNFFCRNGLLALPRPQIPGWLMLDLRRNKTMPGGVGLSADRIFGFDRQRLVYQHNDSLVIYDWRQQRAIQEFKINQDDMVGCVYHADFVLLLSGDRVRQYFPDTGKLKEFHLPEKTAGGFLFDQGFIYVGTVTRQLLKFSLAEKKVIWRLKLGANLFSPPLATPGRIGIVPRDNTLVLVSVPGTVRWWTKLDSYPLFPPLAMKDNLALFLLNQEIRFINPLTQAMRSWRLKGPLLCAPVYCRQQVYVARQGEAENTFQVVRIGNRFAVDVDIDAGLAPQVGRSVRFDFKTTNLIEPQLLVRVVDLSGTSLLTRELSPPGPSSFLLWMPEKPGEFRIEVLARGLNRSAQTSRRFMVAEPAPTSGAKQ